MEANTINGLHSSCTINPIWLYSLQSIKIGCPLSPYGIEVNQYPAHGKGERETHLYSVAQRTQPVLELPSLSFEFLEFLFHFGNAVTGKQGGFGGPFRFLLLCFTVICASVGLASIFPRRLTRSFARTAIVLEIRGRGRLDTTEINQSGESTP